MITKHWVVLDGWGVIYEEPDFVQRLLIPHLRALGCTLPTPAIFSTYLEASLGRITPAQFWSGVGFPESGGDVERRFVQQRPELATNARLVIEHLRGHYHLGLLSNDVAAWAEQVRARFGIDGAFREVLVSSQAGLRKPDPAVYLVFLERAQAAAGDCVFVDDRPENLAAAAAVGMRTIHFQRASGPPCDAASAAVATLVELPEAIARTFATAE